MRRRREARPAVQGGAGVRRPTLSVLGAVLAAAVLSGCVGVGARNWPGSQATAEVIDLTAAGWQGHGIAYSGYRRGQSPEEEIYPSREQVAEDLRLLARNWRLIRIYKADRHGADVLEVIRREGLDLKVMLGIWLDREPGHEEENEQQIEDAIRLASEYEDVVVAVNVGNEVLVEWTAHPVPEERMIGYVRRVKAAVSQPVTVADNYVWWRDEGAALAREVDFITLHTYPLYERKEIGEGLSYTIENLEDVRAAHPGVPLVIGEAGWATYADSNLNLPRVGDEASQKRYYRELSRWARQRGITVFWFEAFDEPWKGEGTEGHWGLFTVDREAKPVMRRLYPDLRPDGPTSPDYPEHLAASGPGIGVALRADLAAAVQGGSVNLLGPGLGGSEVVPVSAGEGATALGLVFTGDGWGGVYFFLDGYDAGAARAVSMRLRLPDDVARLELKLEGPATVSGTVNLMEHEVERHGDGWRTFSVPLSEFREVDLSRIAILGLWNPQDRAERDVSCRVVVDDIHFE